MLASGHAAFNAEPVAEFVDGMVLGDGELAVLTITELVTPPRGAALGYPVQGSTGYSSTTVSISAVATKGSATKTRPRSWRRRGVAQLSCLGAASRGCRDLRRDETQPVVEPASGYAGTPGGVFPGRHQ